LTRANASVPSGSERSADTIPVRFLITSQPAMPRAILRAKDAPLDTTQATLSVDL